MPMIKAVKKAIPSELQAAISQAVSSRDLSLVPSRNSHEDLKMERFLQDLANEKPARFTAEQLRGFTSNFSTRLGSGGFGVVYKGQFLNGVKIAVKVLNRSSDTRAEEQFMAEMSTTWRTYHRHLVRLFGFCYDHSMSALVYEFMENGSLDKYLFSDKHEISWLKLYEIAIGTAKGIAYLHEECKQRIIHYDIKPGNVLLDSNFTPKISDFGLAKLSYGESTTVTGFRGTPGYSAPELLLMNYRITHKCDVYSFGMLLFEIVGRRRNANDGPADSIDWYPKHVWNAYEKGKLSDLTTASGIEVKDREKAERMAMVALWCVQDSPEARPPMSAVVKMLEGGVEIMPPPMPFRYLFSAGMTRSHGSSYSTRVILAWIEFTWTKYINKLYRTICTVPYNSTRAILAWIEFTWTECINKLYRSTRIILPWIEFTRTECISKLYHTICIVQGITCQWTKSILEIPIQQAKKQILPGLRRTLHLFERKTIS